jgi:hypothetical protein
VTLPGVDEAAARAPIAYHLEPLFCYQVRIGAPQRIGPGPDGLRAFYPVVDGSLCGPRICGRVLRAAGRLSAAGSRYLWLNRLQCLFIGAADTRAGVLEYDAYAVR